MERLVLLAVCWLALAVKGFPQKVEIEFEVFMGDERIGTLKAVEQRQGNTSTMVVSTSTEATILAISMQLEQEISVTKENDILIRGTAYRRANPGEDIKTSVKRIGAKSYQHNCNGEVRTVEEDDIRLCSVDLYFREPKGMTKIFSNMHGDYVPLKQVGAGKYQFVTPDKKDSFYTYRNGKLVLIEAETPLGRIISKRR